MLSTRNMPTADESSSVWYSALLKPALTVPVECWAISSYLVHKGVFCLRDKSRRSTPRFYDRLIVYKA